MADNTVLPTSDAGGDTIASDEISGVKYPRSKIVIGADGTNDGDVSAANPLPIGANTVKDGSGTVYAPLVDADGHFQIDVLSAASTAVTNAGTFAVQASQAGTWTVDLGATDNAVLDSIVSALGGTLTVDGSGVTQPISADSLPLPSGASTAAKQPALGTAGTASSDVITVQGVASMTALIVDGSGVTQPVSGTVTANLSATDNAVLDNIDTATAAIQAAVEGTLAVGSHAVTNAGTFAVQAAQSGSWTVDLGSTDNAVLDAIAASVSGTLAVGSHAVTNAGTFATQEDGAALTALQLIDNGVYVDDGDWTATSSSHYLVGGVYQSTPGSITDGDVGPFRVNQNGALHVSIKEGAGSGGTSATDDSAFTAGSGGGTPAMGFFSADTVDAGDVGVLAMDASRRLLVSIEADNVGIGGGTQYTEDAAAPANPVGNALMAERDNALGGLTPAEGDWTHLFADANGALYVNVNTSALPSGAATETTLDAIKTAVEGTLTVDSHAVTNAGTFAVQAAQSGTWNVTNVSGTVSLPTGAATAAKQPALGTAGSASSDVITVQGIASMTALAVDGSGVTQPVSGTVTANLSATDNAVLDSIDAAINGTLTVGAHAVTNAGTFAVQVDGTALTRLTDIETNTDFGATTGGGTEAGALRVTIANNSTGVVSVDDNGGSLTVDGTVTANLSATDNAVLDSIQTAVETIDNTVVVEDAAADANPTGNMMMAVRDDEVGATAVTSADGDVTSLRTDKFGALKTTQLPDATSEIKYAVIDAASSGDNTIQAAAGAGIRIRVLSVFLISAGAVNVRFESGAGGTALTGQMNLVANTGFVLPYNPAGWFQTADNALLNLELSAAISVDGCVTYVEV